MDLKKLKEYLEYNHPLIFTKLLPEQKSLVITSKSVSFYKPIIGSDDRWYTDGIQTHLIDLFQKEGFEFSIHRKFNMVFIYKKEELKDALEC
jgi:hypothetical protein